MCSVLGLGSSLVPMQVAEDCILKWIKQFVKPVIVKQEHQRRQTVC